MAFNLDGVTIDTIESAYCYNSNYDLVYALSALKDSSVEVTYDCPVERRKIEKAVKILNAEQQVFDVDLLARTLAKCKEEGIAFAKIEAVEQDCVDREGRHVRKVFTRKNVSIYYPYVSTDVYYPYERDGDYLTVFGDKEINAIISLIDYKTWHEEGSKKEPKIDFVLENKKIDSIKSQLKPPIQEKPVVEELPNVEVVTKFVSEIGISIAKLKDEVRWTYGIGFWEILQSIVDLEDVMNGAIKMLEKIEEDD